MELILLILGIVIGFILAYFLINKIAEAKARITLQRWILENKDGIRKDTLDKSRAVLKGKIGEQIAVLLPEFPYMPSDARFIGNPIDYIVFDGYSEGKDINLILLDVKKGEHAKLNKNQKKIKEAVDNKRIRWKTLNLK